MARSFDLGGACRDLGRQLADAQKHAFMGIAQCQGIADFFLKPHLSQPLLRERIATEVEQTVLRCGFSAAAVDYSRNAAALALPLGL
jgi:hypothetical protein